jgi:hypothetical protein
MTLYIIYGTIYCIWYCILYLALYILCFAFYIVDFIIALTQDLMSKMIEFSWVGRLELNLFTNSPILSAKFCIAV